MKNLWQEIKYAFTSSPAENILSSEDKMLLEKIAQKIIARKMTTPALLLLESIKPVNFIGSQIMIALKPIIELFAQTNDYERVVHLLGKRQSLEVLIRLIEKVEKGEKKKKNVSRN